MKRFFLSSLAAILTFGSGTVAMAGGPRDLIGEIDIEDSGGEKNTYAETQAIAISYFQNLASVTAQLAQGATTGAVPMLSDNAISFMNAVYLYCAINYGECPLVLDAMLEVDVINSRLSKEVQCPLMTRFWKIWVKTDMEARHKYQVKTGFLKTTSDFNQNKRAAYLKCAETITKEIASKDPDSSFFKNRYAADSAHTFVAAKTAKLLEDLKVKVPNIFAAVGTSFAASAGENVTVQKKR